MSHFDHGHLAIMSAREASRTLIMVISRSYLLVKRVAFDHGHLTITNAREECRILIMLGGHRTVVPRSYHPSTVKRVALRSSPSYDHDSAREVCRISIMIISQSYSLNTRLT